MRDLFTGSQSEEEVPDLTYASVIIIGNYPGPYLIRQCERYTRIPQPVPTYCLFALLLARHNLKSHSNAKNCRLAEKLLGNRNKCKLLD